MVRIDVLPGDTLRVGRWDGADPLDVAVVVVERQAVAEHLAEPRRGPARGLEVSRQPERDVRFGLGELSLGDRLLADATQLPQELDQRAVEFLRELRRI